jgi:hopanoid biosynthesis associated protein HpnK
LVVNADDFGRTAAINTAVVKAFREGIVTSASLMVTADCAEEAVQAARDNPGLAVGLHLVVLGGRAALPPGEIPHLVDGTGRFSRRAVVSGMRYFFLPAARQELRREIEAQFQLFGDTGLTMSHVDGHHHMHLHPTVFRLLLPSARAQGARAVRLNVADDLLFCLRIDRRNLWLKFGWKITFALLQRWCTRLLRRAPLPAADRVYGLMQTGRITETYLVQLLDRLEPGISELFCHPSLREESAGLGPNPRDLSAVISPVVRRAVEKNGISLINYLE